MPERTLLLVDDEENIVRSLRRLLRRDGYEILTATSGQEGLEVLAEHEVGVILSDQRMPGMTGTEFLSRVKDLYPDTVRMVLSGYTDLQAVTDAINRGAIYRFLTKPWDDDLLRDNVRQAFEHYEIYAENRRLTAELQRANEELARRVDRQGRELDLHQRVLELSNEVLEHLPVGVLGIGDDEVIALANNEAHRLMDVPRGGLVGRDRREVVPDRWCVFCDEAPEQREVVMTSVSLEADERDFEVHCTRFYGATVRVGRVLVLVPWSTTTRGERHRPDGPEEPT